MNSAMLLICLFLPIACGSGAPSKETEDGFGNEPKRVSGLEVKGARSEENVIHNMWPVVCRAQELYLDRLKENPKVKGIIELKLEVEFNGEIGAHSIARSTLEDTEFEQQVIRLFQFMDFDPYGPDNTETTILYPIHFKP